MVSAVSVEQALLNAAWCIETAKTAPTPGLRAAALQNAAQALDFAALHAASAQRPTIQSLRRRLRNITTPKEPSR